MLGALHKKDLAGSPVLPQQQLVKILASTCMVVAKVLVCLQHGADVNARDHTGQTALHWTAVRGSIQVAEQLLQHGADVELADNHGYRVSPRKGFFGVMGRRVVLAKPRQNLTGLPGKSD